jgi:hypothetical protein
MSKNLVKILATLGLIIIIAVVLKSVFGIGKIGFKSLTNKNIIIFDKCWNPSQYKNYNEAFVDSYFEQWYFEIDLSKGIAVRTVIMNDETIKRWKEKKGYVEKKVTLNNFYIKSKTQNYIETKIKGDDLTTPSSYSFNLTNGQLILNFVDKQYPPHILQCDEY